jgi:uncharacterized membrane protein
MRLVEKIQRVFSSEKIKKRYAVGEIDAAEFDRKKKDLE